MQTGRVMAGFAVILALIAGEMQAFAATDERDLIDSKPQNAAFDNSPTTVTPDETVPPKVQLRRRLQRADVTREDLQFYRDSGVCPLEPECADMPPAEVSYIAHQLLKTMADDLSDATKTADKSSSEDAAWDRMMDVWGIVIGIGGVAATSAGAFTAYWLGRRQGSQSSGRRSSGGRTRSNTSATKIRARSTTSNSRKSQPPPQQQATS